jgi:hypothetical protein
VSVVVAFSSLTVCVKSGRLAVDKSEPSLVLALQVFSVRVCVCVCELGRKRVGFVFKGLAEADGLVIREDTQGYHSR